MPKSAILKRTDQNPPVRNGEFVATATVLQISQLAMTSPFVGDFQIIGQGRLIVGEHPDLGERFIVTSGGAFAFNAAGTRTFAVWTRGDGTHTGGDVYLGHPDNFLMYDQSEGTLGLYTAAGAGFIADSDGSLFAGDTDGAHMRWNVENRALEIRNGSDVKISMDDTGNGSFDGMIYAAGGRIYGNMQIDAWLRAGDVDGPAVYIGKFEREEGGATVETGEIIATNADNLPWFHVVAGGGTAGGGWFQVGNPGDYAGRMVYDGDTLQVANWIVDSQALTSPSGYINLDTENGIEFFSLPDETSMSDVNGRRMITFWQTAADVWPTHRINATIISGTPNEQQILIQAQPLPGDRGRVMVSALSDKQANARVRAVGGYDTANQQTAQIDLWAYRSETHNYSRADFTVNAIWLAQYTSATAFAPTVPDGTFVYTDGTWDPGEAGEGLYFYTGGVYQRLALTRDGWKTVAFADSPYTAANIDYLPCNTAAGAITVNLPAIASKPQDWQYTFKLVNATNAVTIYPDGSETIEGAASYVMNTLNEFVTLRRRTTNWDIIAVG